MKNMKLWVRMAALMLALLMTLAVVAACGSGDEPQQSETQGDVADSSSDSTTKLEETTKPNDVEELPEVKYDGKEFKMLLRNNETFVRDMYIAELTGKESTVDIAVYRRNKTVEAKYGVKIAYDKSSSSNLDTDQLTNISQSGSCDYHVIANHGRGMFTYAINGALRNWNTMKYIDVTKDYWNRGMAEDFTINGSLYCMSGDMSYLSVGATVAMVFNKDVCVQIGEEYPYELVLDGEWTFEKFSQMVKKATQGTGTELDPANGDLMGYMTTQYRGPLTVLYSGGGSIVSLNDDKTEIELSLYNSRNEEIYERYFEMLDLPNCKNMGGYGQNVGKIFAEGNILFFDTRLHDIGDLVKSGMDDYGVLPWPKYDEEVDGYYSWCDAWANTFGIPKVFNEADNEFISVVLESMCAEGYRNVMPVYYEDVLQAQYADAAGAQMIDLIRAGRRYDIASYMMCTGEAGDIGNAGFVLISYPDHAFASWWESIESKAKTETARINAIFAMVTDLEQYG